MARMRCASSSTQPCDVVVCDENMPVMNGRQLVDAMKAERELATIPVILMAESWGRALPRSTARSCSASQSASPNCSRSRPPGNKARRTP